MTFKQTAMLRPDVAPIEGIGGRMDYSAAAASIKGFEQRLEKEGGLRVQAQALLKKI